MVMMMKAEDNIGYTADTLWTELKACHKKGEPIGSLKPQDYDHFVSLEEEDKEKFEIAFNDILTKRIAEVSSQLEIKKEEPKKESFFGISTFNNYTDILILKGGRKYDQVITIRKKNSVCFKTTYSLYEGIFGAGHPSVFILTKDKLEIGDNKVYLKQIDIERLRDVLFDLKQSFFYHLCNKELNISLAKKTTVQDKKSIHVSKDRPDLIEEVIQQHSYRFLELTLPVPKLEIESLNTNYLELCCSLLKLGANRISEQLVYASVSHLPEVDPTIVEPSHYARYADNAIMVTAGGEGKTTFSEKITNEPCVTEPTIPNLLGSSDGKIKWFGRLHKRTKTLSIDENQDRLDDGVLGKLNNYMETGRCTRGVGSGIFAEGHAAIRFLGNAKPGKDEAQVSEGQQDLTYDKFNIMRRWKNFSLKLSDNVFPFFRRIGLLMFSLDLPKVSGPGIDQSQHEKICAIFRTIAEGYREPFSKLYHNHDVLNWLNTEFSEDYKSTVESLTKECPDSIVKESIRSRAECYRHTRGQALKLAWLDVGLSDYIKNQECDVDILLESAKRHLTQLNDINLTSIRNILSLTSKDIIDRITESKLKSLSPKYLKILVYCLLLKLSKDSLKDIDMDRIIPLNILEIQFPATRSILNISDKDTYRSFYEVKRKLSHNPVQAKVPLESLGLEYDIHEEVLMISDIKTIKELLSIFENDKNYKNYIDKNYKKNVELQKLQKLQKNKENVVNVVGVVCSFDKSHKKILEWDEKAQAWHHCCHKLADGNQCEDTPCNELNGKWYCKVHFDNKQIVENVE
jgi:hypothetical protein